MAFQLIQATVYTVGAIPGKFATNRVGGALQMFRNKTASAPFRRGTPRTARGWVQLERARDPIVFRDCKGTYETEILGSWRMNRWLSNISFISNQKMSIRNFIWQYNIFWCTIRNIETFLEALMDPLDLRIRIKQTLLIYHRHPSSLVISSCRITHIQS